MPCVSEWWIDQYGMLWLLCQCGIWPDKWGYTELLHISGSLWTHQLVIHTDGENLFIFWPKVQNKAGLQHLETRSSFPKSLKSFVLLTHQLRFLYFFFFYFLLSCKYRGHRGPLCPPLHFKLVTTSSDSVLQEGMYYTLQNRKSTVLAYFIPVPVFWLPF